MLKLLNHLMIKKNILTEKGKVQITGETEDVQAERTRGANHHQRRVQNLRCWLQNEVLSI